MFKADLSTIELVNVPGMKKGIAVIDHNYNGNFRKICQGSMNDPAYAAFIRRVIERIEIWS